MKTFVLATLMTTLLVPLAAASSVTVDFHNHNVACQIGVVNYLNRLIDSPNIDIETRGCDVHAEVEQDNLALACPHVWTGAAIEPSVTTYSGCYVYILYP